MIQKICEIYNLLQIFMKSYLITIAIFLALWFAYKTVRHFYFKLNVQDGEMAPDFTAKLIDGSTFHISDYKGKIILLHFWGSWCGPCRRENPSINKLYADFHDKKFKNIDGFEILSIGVEADEMRWHNAILNDNLHWKNHTSDVNMFEGKITTLFGVRQIPSLILIDQDQKVLGTTWTPEMIRAHLTERLSK